jgi:hypothetical protein
LKLELNIPRVVETAIGKPVINHQNGSPPVRVALLYLAHIDVPKRASVQRGTDKPVNQDNYQIQGIQL